MRRIKLGYIGEIKNFKGNNKELLELFDLESYTVKENVDLMQSHQRVQYGKYIFLVFENKNTREVYRLLPLVVDDEIFNWKELRPHCNWRETQHLFSRVECGLLTFCVNYYTNDGSVRINVFFHNRTTSPIHTIRLNDGDYSNEEILKAMKDYIEDFKLSASRIEIA